MTKAPITPKEVTLKFSNILLFVDVFKNGYKKSGMWAFKNSALVWGWRAKHWSRPTTKQILFDEVSLRFGGGESSV